MHAELLDDPRLTIVGLFMEAHEGLTTKFSTRFESHALSETEFEVLLRLARTPNRRLRMSDLSAQTSLSTSGITRVADRLERDGLVARDTCEEDRRGTWQASPNPASNASALCFPATSTTCRSGSPACSHRFN
jgi:MarR family transcriptional regulator, 2-MHQ and catechol-resistance regulon repressor